MPDRYLQVKHVLTVHSDFLLETFPMTFELKDVLTTWLCEHFLAHGTYWNKKLLFYTTNMLTRYKSWPSLEQKH